MSSKSSDEKLIRLEQEGQMYEVMASKEDVGLIKTDSNFARAFLEQAKRKTGLEVSKGSYKLNLFDPLKKKTYLIQIDASLYVNARKDMAVCQSLLDQIQVRCESTSTDTPLQSIQNNTPSIKFNSGQKKEDDFNAQCLSDFYKNKKEEKEDVDNTDPDESENEEAKGDVPNKKRKKRCVWLKQEVPLLLCSYKDHQDLFNTNRNKFWRAVLKDLDDKNCGKDLTQIKDKMEALKKDYKNNIIHDKKTGVNSVKIPFYDELDELFRNKPWVNPKSIAGSHEAIPSRDKIPKGSSAVHELVDFMKESQQKKQEMDEKKFQLQEKTFFMKQKFLDEKLKIMQGKLSP